MHVANKVARKHNDKMTYRRVLDIIDNKHYIFIIEVLERTTNLIKCHTRQK